MSGAWSVGDTKLVVDAVRHMKSTGCALDWQSIRDTLLPFRTAKAIERQYYAHVQQDADSDASEEDYDTTSNYFGSFRAWVRDPLSADLRLAAARLCSAESMQVSSN